MPGEQVLAQIVESGRAVLSLVDAISIDELPSRSNRSSIGQEFSSCACLPRGFREADEIRFGLSKNLRDAIFVAEEPKSAASAQRIISGAKYRAVSYAGIAPRSRRHIHSRQEEDALVEFADAAATQEHFRQYHRRRSFERRTAYSCRNQADSGDAHKLGDHGLAEKGFYSSPIFRGAIQQVRGEFFATMRDKHEFVQSIFKNSR